MYSLIRDMIDTYEKSGPAVAMRLDQELRQDGITAVRSGGAEIGLFALEPTPDAMDDPSLKLVAIGLDAIVVAINADNPLQGISLDELRRIYAGHITSWADLGGSPAPLEVVGRTEGSDARRVLETKVMHGTAFSLEAILAPSSEAVAEYVEPMWEPSAISPWRMRGKGPKLLQ